MIGHNRDIVEKPLLVAMPELKGQEPYELLAHVVATGETVARNEVPTRLIRGGKQETAYFTFNDTPLLKDKKIIGVIDVAVEVTDQVVARQSVEVLNDDLAAINEEMAASNEELAATNEELASTQTSLQQAMDKLMESELSLRMATESADIGTWMIAGSTSEFRSSSRCKEIFGYPADAADSEMTYADVFQRIHEAYRAAVGQAADLSMKDGALFQTEYPITRLDDQKTRWVRSIGRANLDHDGRLVTFSGVIIDITEQKQDEQRKNDFIGMVSHELKTPLTSLYGYIQMLQLKSKQASDVFAPAALEKAINQVKKMTAMVNGFLNLSRLESGKIIVNKTPFQLDDLVKEMIEDAAVTQSSHQITFAPGEPVKVNADQDKISIVISNLLSNAIKYSPRSGKVEVVCEVKGNLVQVAVKDYGIGIRPQDIDKLFERYYRVENHNISGFGIGLYLSSEIIKRHDGQIWVESEEGKGSTFYFELPVE